MCQTACTYNVNTAGDLYITGKQTICDNHFNDKQIWKQNNWWQKVGTFFMKSVDRSRSNAYEIASFASKIVFSYWLEVWLGKTSEPLSEWVRSFEGCFSHFFTPRDNCTNTVNCSLNVIDSLLGFVI